MCFEKKILRNPLEILCSACVYMRYWVGLYLVVTKEVIEERVDLMLQTTIKLLGKKAKTARLTLAIEDKKTPDGGDDKDA
jgi:hypothetical protein